jgi:hypothetical protein
MRNGQIPRLTSLAHRCYYKKYHEEALCQILMLSGCCCQPIVWAEDNDGAREGLKA